MPLENKDRKMEIIGDAISKALEKETAKIIEEEAEYAGKRVVERVRAMAGQIATKVCSYVEFTRMRDEVVITVKVPKE